MSVIDDIITDLQKFYSKQMNDTQVLFWRSQLNQLDEDDLCAGIIALKGKEPTTWLPSTFTVRKYAAEAREIRLNREKEKAPIFSDLERNANRTEHGRRAIRLMRGLNEGRSTRANYLAAMYSLDREFPAYGWAIQADELKAFWDSESERHEVGKRYLARIGKLDETDQKPEN